MHIDRIILVIICIFLIIMDYQIQMYVYRKIQLLMLILYFGLEEVLNVKERKKE